MRPLTDDSEFEWIEESRSKPVGRYDDAKWAGNPVSLVIPPLFDRYLKVLHRLEPHYENIDNPLAPEELRVLGIPECHKLQALVNRYRDMKPPRIPWKAVAKFLGIAYAPAISDEWFRAVLESGCWHRYIYGPADCWLESEEFAEIASTFGNAGSEALFMRIAQIPVIGTETPLLYEISFDRLKRLIEGERNPLFPEYWWPKDRNWCVCSDYDLPYTLIGCEDSTADKLLRSGVLECIEVRPETRVDSRAPIEFASA